MKTIYHYLSADEHPEENEGFMWHYMDEIDQCPICGPLSSTNFINAMNDSGYGYVVKLAETHKVLAAS